jgi:hypothetical protein
MNLHGQIMNIQVTSADIGKGVEEGMKLDNDIESKLALAYKIGHRDARHAAAELSLLPSEPRTCETCSNEWGALTKEEIIRLLTNKSVWNLLRHGYKCPSNYVEDDDDSDALTRLYEISNELIDSACLVEEESNDVK